MVRAIWNDAVVAESDDTIVVEGNHYFPPASVDWQRLEKSRKWSVCPWKGIARYWDVRTPDGDESNDAAWSYPHPLPWIRKIRGHVAFWADVEVTQD